MKEVTSQNFEECLPEVMTCIQKSSFVAIDTEFTGLPFGCQKSLFDSLDERYMKLREELSPIIIIQFGLTTFTKDINNNRYTANSFAFYLRPPSFGSIDKRFTVQASGLKFLYHYNFDFTKAFQHGIEYLNEDEARCLRRDMKTKSLLTLINSEKDQESLLECCCQVSQWLIKTKDPQLVLDDSKLKGIDDYVIFSVLRERNHGCWISRNNENKIVVERLTPERRKELMKDIPGQEEKWLNAMYGFTRVFRKLVECKKPLVGHNCLCDLLLMFQQFHQSLPKTLKSFREEFLALFPMVFDTKHICLDSKKELEESISLGRGDLEELYTTFLKSPLSAGTYYSPEICHSGTNSVKVSPHHAGFDSYACGFVFLKLAHLLAVRKLLGRSKPMTWVEHLDSLDAHKNRINLIRSGEHFLDLSGGSSCDRRPRWLYVQSKSSTALDIERLTELLSSYGTVDIKSLSRNSALLAVGNLGCARDIMRAFYESPDYEVTSYSHLRHSTSGRLTLWSIVACFGGFSLALIFQIVKMIS